MSTDYDYIIAGAGASGLSLALHLVQSGKFTSKKILLVDKAPKNINDRTWCFWETGSGLFEPIVYKRWSKLWFHSGDFSSLNTIDPYTYKLVRGIDFYNYCFSLIGQQKNITIQYGDVSECFSTEKQTGIILNGERITGQYVFNSIRFENPPQQKRRNYLLQHFKGCLIQTEQVSFEPSEATLMDFRVNQDNGTAFVYVMPFSATEALVEYTLFSDKLLEQDEYDKGIKFYCENVLKLRNYTINGEEFGVIPMTDHPFLKRHHNLINIGTAGGQTKASSGYTFQFIQKSSREIVDALIKTGKPFYTESIWSRRHAWFDSVLLSILAKKKLPGKTIFSTLLKNNEMKAVLKFLDNDTTIAEEIKLISSLPTAPFLKAAIQTLFR